MNDAFRCQEIPQQGVQSLVGMEYLRAARAVVPSEANKLRNLQEGKTT